MVALNEHTKALRDEYVRREAELAHKAVASKGTFMREMKALLDGVEGASSEDRENALIGFLALNMASLYGLSKLSRCSDYEKFSELGLLTAMKEMG